jgi:hypothetical protein
MEQIEVYGPLWLYAELGLLNQTYPLPARG